MKYFNQVMAPAFCAMLALATTSTGAWAADWNKKAPVALGGPVETPGVHASGGSPAVPALGKPAPKAATPAGADQPPQTVPPATFPETFGYLPQIAVIGFLALASAIALRAVRKRPA